MASNEQRVMIDIDANTWQMWPSPGRSNRSLARQEEEKEVVDSDIAELQEEFLDGYNVEDYILS